MLISLKTVRFGARRLLLPEGFCCDGKTRNVGQVRDAGLPNGPYVYAEDGAD